MAAGRKNILLQCFFLLGSKTDPSGPKFFKLLLGALIPRSVGCLVGLSAGLLVGLSVLQKLQQNYKTLQNITKRYIILQNKLGLNWAKLSFNWNWDLLHTFDIILPNKMIVASIINDVIT